jgi:hypothetical protein
VKDFFAAHGNLMLVKGGPFQDLQLERIVDIYHQFTHELLQNGCGGNAIDQEFIQLFSSGHQSLGALFLGYVHDQLTNVQFPISGRKGLVVFHGIAISLRTLDNFEYQEGLAEVAVTFVSSLWFCDRRCWSL